MLLVPLRMEMESVNRENDSLVTCWWVWLKSFGVHYMENAAEIARELKAVGQEDPRRVIHSLKVGLALALASLIYYFDPLYNFFGDDAVWVIITVVFISEFHVGATFGKSFNRVLGTLGGAALGAGAYRFAALFGEKGKFILIGIFVFTIAAVVSYMRFVPRWKAKHDYGLLIFILTFSMIAVTGYREEEVIEIAQIRAATVVIGTCIVVVVSACTCPVWIGQDLHNLVAANLENLANHLQGLGNEYFWAPEEGLSNDNKSVIDGYKRILTSKTNEESMANLARWEPGHGGFRRCHPWKQYLQVGNLTRQCAQKIEALNHHLKLKKDTEIQSKIKQPCRSISSESGKALQEIATALKSMVQTNSANPHIVNSKIAGEDLKSLLKTRFGQEADLLEMMPAAAVASLVLQVMECSENIVEAVYELASLAHFKRVENVEQDAGNVLQITDTSRDVRSPLNL